MAKKELIFHDFFDVHLPKMTDERRDMLQTSLQQGNNTVLDAVADVSFAGWYSSNRMMYLPTEFQKSMVHWTTPYNKPVQIHHEDHQDPIGRVMAVKYVDTSQALTNNKNVQAFISPDINFSTRLDLTNEIFGLQKSLDNYDGLGRLRAHLRITDPAAIQKVADGRYLTLSSGYRPESVYCNICQKDIKESLGMFAEEGCPHQPGKKDEETGKMAMWIPVGMNWTEVSYVNHPAIKLCQTVKVGSQAIDEFFEKNPSKDDERIPEVWTQSLYTKDDESFALDSNKSFKFTDNILDVISTEDSDRKSKKTVIENQMEKETEISEFIPADFNELTDYLSLVKILDELDMIDRKLSTTERKKLKKETFCGPDRCLRGDTKIKLLDGRDVEIQNIPALLDVGEDIWVYGFNLERRMIVPAKVEKAWKTIENAPLLKLTLDNDQIVFCTHDHPILMRDRKYIEAQDLKVGDSIMPLYTAKGTMYSRNSQYEEILQPYLNKWEFTHHMSFREFTEQPVPEGHIIHHVNKNKLDNRPLNLQAMTRDEHMKLHDNDRPSNFPRTITDEARKAKSAFMHKRMEIIENDPILKEQHAKALSEGRRECDWDNPKEKIGITDYNLIDVSLAVGRGVDRTFVSTYFDVSPSTVSYWLANTEFDSEGLELTNGAVKLIKAFFLSEFGYDIDEVYDDFIGGLSKVKLQRKYGIDRETIRQYFNKLGFVNNRFEAVIAKEFGSVKEIKSAWLNGEISLAEIERKHGLGGDSLGRYLRRKQREIPFNHKIVAIEEAESSDVWDLRVPATENFALSAGIFVHNSFPVPDCAHVTAARRLIGRYKGGGSKEKILACVSRKASELGCGGKDEGEEPMTEFVKSMLVTKDNYTLLCEFIPEANRLTDEALAKLEDKVFLGANRTYPAHDLIHAEACQKLAAKFGEESKDDRSYQIFTEKITVRLDELKAEDAAKGFCKECKKPKDKCTCDKDKKEEKKEKPKDEDTVKQLKDAQDELKVKSFQYEGKIDELERAVAALETTNQTLTDEIHNILAELTQKIQELRNTGDKLDEAALKAKTNDELKAFVLDAVKPPAKIEPEVKDEVKDKTIPSPVLKAGSAQSTAKDKVLENQRKYGDIYAQYMKLKDTRGDRAALTFVMNQIRVGYLPQDVTFEVPKENK